MTSCAVRLPATVACFAAALLFSGCGATRPNPVTGKVTVDDRPVRSGQVTFVGGPDGQKHTTIIGYDGRYSIEVPPGEYKVGVEGGSGPPGAKMAHIPPPTMPKGLPPMKDPTGAVAGTGVDVAKEQQNPVVVPMKYRAPESSGFSFTVTGSGGTFDLPMKSKG